MTSERRAALVCALILWLGLAWPGMRQALEAAPPGHMLVQMPLLIGVGLLLARALPAGAHSGMRRIGMSPGGLALLAVFCLLFWMVPRAMDLALEQPVMELAKFLSLPLLAGLPLGCGWARLSPVLRGVLAANLVSMLAFLGWLYREAPVRVCNNYLVDQQQLLGELLLAAAAALAGERILRAFVGGARQHAPADGLLTE